MVSKTNRNQRQRDRKAEKEHLYTELFATYEPIHPYPLHFVHNAATCNELKMFIDTAQTTTKFVFDTESNYLTNFSSIIQVMFMKQIQENSLVLIIETARLPVESSYEFLQLKQSFYFIFRTFQSTLNDNDDQDNADTLIIKAPAFDPIIFLHPIAINNIKRSRNEAWSIQDATAYILNQYLPKKFTLRQWFIELDERILNRNKTFSSTYRRNMISYAANDFTSLAVHLEDITTSDDEDMDYPMVVHDINKRHSMKNENAEPYHQQLHDDNLLTINNDSNLLNDYINIKHKIRQRRTMQAQKRRNQKTSIRHRKNRYIYEIMRPINMSIKLVKNKLKEFGINYLNINIRLVQHLAEKFGLVPKSKHQRITLQLADKLKTDVHNFYQRDDISYQLPGKRDTVVVKDDDGKKVTYQKRILINNLRETYEFFKDENKSVDLSRSSFADLRPVFVFSKSALAHRNWLCVYHENVRLLLKDVDKYVDGTQCSSLSTFTDSLVCSTNNEECMFGCCSICKDFFSENIQENVSNSNSKITWSQWARENGRVEKKEFSGSVDEAILMFKSKIEFFLFHVYIKREQSKYFEKLKTEVIDEKILLQVDFAENFNMKEQDEIQSAHWNTKPLSIFTAFVWSKSKSFSFALPSLDLTHDKFVANAALKIILNHIETVLPNVLEVNCFSDGAASQFKQRFLFRNLMQSVCLVKR
ncbi:unnamed protein product [Rotaria socialis]